MNVGTRVKVKDYDESLDGAEGVVVEFQTPFYFVDLDEYEPVKGPIPHWLFFVNEIEPVS